MSTTHAPATTAVSVAAPPISRVSWGAVIAGVFVVLSLQILLNLLGAGVGLSQVTPSEATTEAAKSAGLASLGWIGFATLLSLLAGGFVAGRLSGGFSRGDGVLHGVLTWAAVLVLTLYFLTSAASSLVGQATSVVGGAAGMIADTAKQVAPAALSQAQGAAQANGVGTDDVAQAVDGIFGTATSDPAGLSREDARKEVLSLAPQIWRGGPEGEAAKQRGVAIVAAQLNISPEEATRRIDEAQARATETKDKVVASAKTNADQAAQAISSGAFIGFATLGLALVAAAIGGAFGARRRRFAAH